jgi:hypothetical protein
MSKKSNKVKVEPKSNELNVKIIKGAGGMVYLYVNDVLVAGPVDPAKSIGDVICEFNTSVLDLPRITRS